MNVTVFTDTLVVRDEAGRHVPARDQFPRFISRLADTSLNLFIASRCTVDPNMTGVDPIDEQAVKFVELPFYEDTEDYFRRRRSIRARSLPIIRQLVVESDVVFLRIHHAMAGTIASVAADVGRPVAAYFAGPPILASVRANYPGRSVKHAVARLVASRKRRVHARIASRAKWCFVVDPVEFAELGSPMNSQAVVPSLIEEDDLVAQPLGRGQGEPLRICFAGRIYRHKGVFDLVQAVQRVLETGRAIELEIAGQGPDQEELCRKIAQLAGCFARVHGALQRNELYDLMRSCHVFALPSYGEGMPKVLLEAWAAGLAVVTTPVGAVPDHIQHRRQGLLHRPGDVEGLTANLTALWDDEDLRRTLCEAGLGTVRGYTWSAGIRKIAARLISVGSTGAGDRSS